MISSIVENGEEQKHKWYNHFEKQSGDILKS